MAPATDTRETVSISAAILADIERRAADSAPLEACGLLVGSRTAGGYRITRAVASRNLAASPDRFEVDPLLQLEWQKRLRGTGEAVIGHYHSHPKGPAEPSARDIDDAHDPELLWLICRAGEPGSSRAFIISRGDGKAVEVKLNQDKADAGEREGEGEL